MQSNSEFWVPDADESFIRARLHHRDDDCVIFVDVDGVERKIAVKEADSLSRVHPDHYKGVNNICSLEDVTQAAVLSTVRTRYLLTPAPKIYTAVSQILIALNPFQWLPIYSRQVMDRYLSAHEVSDLEPHIFTIGHYAVKGITADGGSSQVVLISGESGAGKTESAKLVLSYVSEALGEATQSECPITEKIMRSNPILESFGNAMTVRNNNSSRFGKFVDVRVENYGGKPVVTGCRIHDYLLEQTRVVKQGSGERNYHVFFQVVNCAPKRFPGKFEPMRMEDYNYVKGSKHTAPGIDDTQFFEDHVEALSVLGVSDDTIVEMFQVVLASLTVGNVDFQEFGDGDGSSVVDETAVENTAKLLGVDCASVKSALTTKIIQVGKEKTEVLRNVKDARAARDCISKLLYSRLFKYVLKTINVELRGTSSDENRFFGVLDIAGFESFEQNSIEQLFINLSNEHLQMHFNDNIFKMELEDYKNEEISVGASLTYKDNADIIALIDSKVSLLSSLDEELTVPKATDVTYLNKACKTFEKAPNFSKPKFTNGVTFGVKHFAGEVTYNVTGWLEKNIDKAPEGLAEMFSASSVNIVKEIAKHMLEDVEDPDAKKKKKVKTVASGFRSSLVALMAKVRSAEPHYIRCIKPNMEKTPSKITSALVMDQLNTSGVFEAVRIRQSGFSHRILFEDFVKQFAVIRPKKTKGSSPLADAQTLIDYLPRALQCVGDFVPEDVVLGKTKVFLRSQLVTFLQKAKDLATLDRVLRIQADARGYLVRKKTKEAQIVHKTAKQWRDDHKVYEKPSFDYSAIRVFGTVDAIRLQIGVLRPLLDSSKVIIAPIPLKLDEFLNKSLSKMVIEADCCEQLEGMRCSLNPVEIDRLLVRAKQIGIQALPVVNELFDRQKHLKVQLPLGQALLNILEDDSAVHEDFVELEETLQQEGLESKDKWLKELDYSKELKSLKKKIESTVPTIVPETIPMFTTTIVPPGGSDQAPPPTMSISVTKRKTERATCRGTITGLSQEGKTSILLTLVGAMDTFDVGGLSSGLTDAITHGVEEQMVIREAKDLYDSLQTEEFLKLKIAELIDMIKGGIGDKQYNLSGLKNLSDQAMNISVALDAAESARRFWNSHTQSDTTKLEAVLSGNELPDESLVNSSFLHLRKFKGLRNLNEWKGHKRPLLKVPTRQTKSEKMLDHSTRPILASLTQLSVPDEKIAINAYALIQGWMYDRTSPSRSTLGHEIIDIAGKSPQLADEIYVQLVKQLVNNPNIRSVSAGWTLLQSLVHEVKPSESLVDYIQAFILVRLRNTISEYDVPIIRGCLRELLGRKAVNDSTLDVQIQLMDGTSRKFNFGQDVTIDQAAREVERSLGVVSGDWQLFQGIDADCKNQAYHNGARGLPGDILIKNLIARMVKCHEMTSKTFRIVLRKAFLAKREVLSASHLADAKLTFAQAVSDFLIYPFVEHLDSIARIAAFIMNVNRSHFKHAIKVKKLIDFMDRLVPVSFLSGGQDLEAMEAMIFDHYEVSKDETPFVSMGACFREMSKFTLFGSMWWKGKQISEAPKAKASFDQKAMEDHVKKLSNKFGLHVSPDTSTIAPAELFPRSSIGFESFLQLSPEGITFVLPPREKKTLKEKLRGAAVPVVPASTRFFSTSWSGSDCFMFWSAKQNVLQVMSVLVDTTRSKPTCTLARIDFQSTPAVDICFALGRFT